MTALTENCGIRRTRFGYPLVCLVATTLLCSSGWADNANRSPDGKADAPDRQMAYLMTSAQLARISQDLQDPILMLAAARLEAMASRTPVDRDKTTEGDGTIASTTESKAESISLYALAEEFAEEREHEALVTLIRESKAAGAGTRGADPGPQWTSDSVLAYRTDVYGIDFRGGEPARVTVDGDGDTDLDLYVYDQNGNLICSDEGITDYMNCHWRPRWTGRFTVKIKNLGGVYNAYDLDTN